MGTRKGRRGVFQQAAPFSEIRLQLARKFRKVAKKERLATQNSSGIHRVLVLMPVCTRIRVRGEKGKPVVRRGRKA